MNPSDALIVLGSFLLGHFLRKGAEKEKQMLVRKVFQEVRVPVVVRVPQPKVVLQSEEESAKPKLKKSGNLIVNGLTLKDVQSLQKQYPKGFVSPEGKPK